jgi:hypothetical protein
MFTPLPGAPDTDMTQNTEAFWYFWRIYYLLPIPFMLISILIFLKFANSETIKFLVSAQQEKDAIMLMRKVIQKKASTDTNEAQKENNDYYQKKYVEYKELGVLYTGLVPS